MSRRLGPISAARLADFDHRHEVERDLAIRKRLLEALRIGGARNRNVVVGIVGGEENFRLIVLPMIAAGEIRVSRARGGRFEAA